MRMSNEELVQATQDGAQNRILEQKGRKAMENIGVLESLWRMLIEHKSMYDDFTVKSEEKRRLYDEIDKLHLTYDQHEALFFALADDAANHELCGFVNGFRLAMSLAGNTDCYSELLRV